MRGCPWLRIILVCIGVMLMGIPVIRLTSAHAPVAVTPSISEPSSEVKALQVSLSFAHAPESCQVTCLDHVILTGTGPQTEVIGTWSTSLKPSGADLLLRVKWPAGTPRTAVEIKVESEGDVLARQTFWGQDKLTEICTVLPAKP